MLWKCFFFRYTYPKWNLSVQRNIPVYCFWINTPHANVWSFWFFRKNGGKIEPKMGHFQDTFIKLYKNILVLTSTICMPWEQWISGFVWHKKSWLLNISPELWFLSSPEKTWYPWFHTVSYRLALNWLMRPKYISFSLNLRISLDYSFICMS